MFFLGLFITIKKKIKGVYKMDYTYVNYIVKVQTGKGWETLDQGGSVFATVGDCLGYLNRVYDLSFGRLYNSQDVMKDIFNGKQILFFWAITDSSNTYTGVTELTNENFLEKVIKFDLSEYVKKES